MGVTHYIQNSLNAGELTPRLSARDDFQRYQNGVKQMVNFVPLPQGGARVRVGLQYVSRTKDNALAYLIGFQFSTTQAYVIEVGDLYMRFYKDGGRIVDLNGTITGAADNGAGLIRITSVAHGLSTNNYAEIVGVLGTVEANNEWKVTNIDADHFDLQASTFTNAYTSGGTWTRPYQITTTYLIADIPLLRWVQSADTLYLVHSAYAPRKLTRTGHTAWTLSITSFVNGPYMDRNTTTTTLAPAATTGANITVTASSVVGINGGTGFASTDVGRFLTILTSGTWGYGKIVTFTDTTHVKVDITNAFGGTGAVTTWRLGSFSDTTSYPLTVNFHEQRIIYGGTPTEPQTLWLSTTASYDDFTPVNPSGTVTDDLALTYRLGADTGKVNVIRWLSGGRRLLVGTVGEEFTIDGGQAAFTPSTPPVARSYTSYGSAAIQAIRVGGQTFYIQRSGRRVRGLQFDYQTDSNASPELSIFAEHIFRNVSVTRMAFQQEPDYLLWVIRANGIAATLTYDEGNQVLAWATQQTNGSFRDVTVIPSTDLTSDTPWFVVQRTVGGATKFFIEFGTYAMDVDSGLAYGGAATTTVTGLHHLVGQTVQVIGDSAVYDPQVVAADGSVVLQYGNTPGPAASTISVGLLRTPNPKITTLQPAYKDQAGTVRNKFKHWAIVEVAIEETIGLTINGTQDLQYRKPSDPMDTGVPTFTGTKRVANLGRSREGLLTFEQTLPLPATLLSYFGELESGD